jgi:hypothetical protein
MSAFFMRYRTTRPHGLFRWFKAIREYLPVDVARACAAAIGDIAGDVDKFTILLAGRTLIGRRLHFYRVPAVVALPDRHSSLHLKRFAVIM